MIKPFLCEFKKNTTVSVLPEKSVPSHEGKHNSELTPDRPGESRACILRFKKKQNHGVKQKDLRQTGSLP